jgi:peptidoglycan hydrolase CwlO-like protein
MKNFILVLLLLGAVASCAFTYYNYQVFNKSKENNLNTSLEEKKNTLKSKEEEIKNKEEELKKIKEDNKDKQEELELWQNELKKVQGS